MQFKKTWAYLIGLLLLGCSSSHMPMDVGTFYKRDMNFKIGNVGSFNGVSVAPQLQSYAIQIEPEGDLPDLLVLRTCHREESFEKGDSNWLSQAFGKKKKLTYMYLPEADIEDNRVCPLRGDAFYTDDDNSQHSWFFLDFENRKLFALQSNITCNGKSVTVNGVGACQARKGLVQVIKFPEDVRWAPTKPSYCNDPVFKYGNRWEIELTLGECLYMAQSKSGALARFTMIGYEGILLREGY